MTTTVVARLAAGSAVAALAIGCSGDPVEPSGPPPPPPPTFSISGVVAEAGTGIADAAVGGWVVTNRMAYGRSDGRTDAQGRYRLDALPRDALVLLTVYKKGYIQQCAAAPLTIQTDVTVDLALVSRTNLTASARQSAPGMRTVTGTVAEMTAAGVQPVPEIYVGFHFDPSGDAPLASTFTDSNGRFALCGLPGSEPVSIGAMDGRRYKFVTVPPGQDSGVQIILP